MFIYRVHQRSGRQNNVLNGAKPLPKVSRGEEVVWHHEL